MTLGAAGRATGLAVAIWLLPAVALAEAPDDYLSRSVGAEFTGRQVVTCSTPDGDRNAVVDLSQSGGALWVRAGEGSDTTVEVGAGTLAVTRPDGTTGTEVGASGEAPRGRYRVAGIAEVDVLDRPATQVTIADAAGVERARLAFDVVTGALLSSRISNADGSVYCETEMIRFEEGGDGSARTGDAAAVVRLEAVDPPADGRLPDRVGGFLRLDTYAWGDGGVIAYYSDGLFSFTLLASDAPVELDAEGVSELTAASGSYARWFGAGQAIYVWETDDGGVAFYGDLPLDLQEEVLADLPAPDRPSLITRWIRTLFG